MSGLMQSQPLLVSAIIRHAARCHPHGEIVSVLAEGTLHRTNYAALERRARRLARVLQGLGVGFGDRVGTLAWNGWRHFELFFAISGSGAICHTLNPRLHPDDVAYIADHAGDCVLFADPGFSPLLETILPRLPHCRAVVMLGAPAEVPALQRPPGVALHCYETLMQQADDAYDWPVFDEATASALCYTSGTTGRPKGVLYSHRSTVLHAMAANTAEYLAFTAMDRVMPGAPMFHAAAWSVPYTTPMVGAAVLLPGRHLDPPSLVRLLNDERATVAGAVPTVWLGVLAHLKQTGETLPHLKRVFSGGSAVPRAMVEGLAAHGVFVQQLWGMTETSPMVTGFAPLPSTEALDPEGRMRMQLKQGRPVFGTEVKIVDADGSELPWDGRAFGDLLVRGPWVCREYLHRGRDGAADPDGWFTTGDIATIDPDGFIELVDRSKDVIKSGGEWISSIALENIAVSHPAVAEAAVINARHAKWQERPLLLVVPQPGQHIDPAEMLAFYDGKVAKWWLPDAVVVVDGLPHTATGKLNKLALRQVWQDYLQTGADRGVDARDATVTD